MNESTNRRSYKQPDQQERLPVLLTVDLLVVELELSTFENVAISTAALSRARRDASQQATSGELLSQSRVEDSGLVSGGEAVLDALAGLILLSSGFSFLSLLLAKLKAVVLLVPLTEGSCINLDDAVLHQGVGTHQFVVGSVVKNGQEAGLVGNGLGRPVEVSCIKTKGSVLEVSSTSTNGVNALSTKFGESGGTAHLELPLLADGNSLATGGPALVGRVARDTCLSR